jgi:hypothetical protein
VKFLEEWRQWHRLWSVRLNLIGSALLSFLLAFPDVAVGAWNALPADMKAMLPERFAMFIPLAFFGLSMFARFVKQEKLRGR